MSTAAPEDLGLLLVRALDGFKHGLHRHLAEAGYPDIGTHYGVIFRALAARPHSLAEIAERLGITPQGALKTVAEMVERGYVVRRDDAEDQRVKRLHLTARGTAALRAARRHHARVERDLTQRLGASSTAAARAVLAALAERATPTL